MVVIKLMKGRPHGSTDDGWALWMYPILLLSFLNNKRSLELFFRGPSRFS